MKDRIRLRCLLLGLLVTVGACGWACTPDDSTDSGENVAGSFRNKTPNGRVRQVVGGGPGPLSVEPLDPR